MSNAIDKKLWLLERRDKELLADLAETLAMVERDKADISELDFGAMDDLKGQAFTDWMALKPDDSTYPVKINLLYLAAHCLRLIKKLH